MNVILFIIAVIVLFIMCYVGIQDVKKSDIERKKRLELFESINDELQEMRSSLHHIYVLMSKAYDSEFDD